MGRVRRSKYIVFFRRVSSKGQDLIMQESADSIYRKQYIPDEIKIIEEHAVSANKLPIADRPKMQQLIKMIEGMQVKKIYAFDRSRLFRDFYESNYFFSLCRKNDVNIFFTSSQNGPQQATGNILIEGVQNIVGDVEGKNIARRTDEVRKRYPPRKIGYLKDKETNTYQKDPNRKNLLYQYFSDLRLTKNYTDLVKILQTYNRELGTNSDQLIRIAQDPFYAGYDLSTGQNKLEHVSPYLTLKQFQELQNKQSLVTAYTEKVQYLREQNIFKPNCGICKKAMNFRINYIEGIARYSCSNKHSRVSVTANDLGRITNYTLQRVIDRLNTQRLLQDSKYYYQKVKRQLKAEIRSTESEKRKVLEIIILENDDLNSWRKHPSYQKLSVLEAKQKQLISAMETKEKSLLENEQIIDLVKEYLDKCRTANLFFISSMLIDNIYIYQNEVKLDINKFDYINNIKNDYIFKGDSLI